MKLSIVMPVYNEEKTVGQILGKVCAVKLPCEKEIIVVNDGSTDKTDVIIRLAVKNQASVIYLKHELNRGKGAAVRTGIDRASGEYVVIQDADLEYDPTDISRMLRALGKNRELVVYGSRLTKPPVVFGRNRTPLLLHYLGNKFLSLITSLLYGSWITDMETCYKLFPKAAMKNIRLKARGFELEPEITAKLLKNGFRIIEIPITTSPRGYGEGKKLNTWKDGYRALKTLIKYRFVD